MDRELHIRLTPMICTETRGVENVRYLPLDGRIDPQVLKRADSYVRYSRLSAYEAAEDFPGPNMGEYVGPQVHVYPTVYVGARVLERGDVVRQYPDKAAFVARMERLGHDKALVTRSGDVLGITSHRIPGDSQGRPLPGYLYLPSEPLDPEVAEMIEEAKANPKLKKRARFRETSELWVSRRGEKQSQSIPLPAGADGPVEPLPDDTLQFMVHYDSIASIGGVAFEHLTGYENGPYIVVPKMLRLSTLEQKGCGVASSAIEEMRKNGLAWAYYDEQAKMVLPVYDLTEVVDRMGRPVDPVCLEVEELPHR